MFKKILRWIKFAYQRAVRGYSDDIFWSFDGYFADFIPAIKEFCVRELEVCKEDERRVEIFSTMLRLIDDWEKENKFETQFNEENATSRLWKYFGDKIMWFWS